MMMFLALILIDLVCVVGVCHACGKAILGQYNAVSAFDSVFHLKCFLCERCGE